MIGFGRSLAGRDPDIWGLDRGSDRACELHRLVSTALEGYWMLRRVQAHECGANVGVNVSVEAGRTQSLPHIFARNQAWYV